jgi:hypothetical protein
MAVTRAKSYIYLIGDPLQKFDGRLLPTVREVLMVYFFNHKIDKLSQKAATQNVVREVCEIWSKARVPTAEERNIIFKLNNSLQIYRNICRNKGRHGAAQVAKEREFESSINQLFDIAHIQAMKLIKIEEDKLFLIDQRTERKMIMSTIDKELAEQEE